MTELQTQNIESQMTPPLTAHLSNDAIIPEAVLSAEKNVTATNQWPESLSVFVYPKTQKLNLAYLSLDDFKELCVFWKESSFRSLQLFQWIWKEKISDFDQMTNLSKVFREKLKENCVVVFPKMIHHQLSNDGTEKFLIQLNDGKAVESVWIPSADGSRITVCVSSQVGCRMGCTFCLTAQQKTERNLFPGEIAAQISVLPAKQRVTNVVVMGMGEPFDNFDFLMKGLSIMTHPEALAIGASHITVSTSGLVPAIKKFVAQSKCRLAISLNAPNNDLRSQIMPINRAYPLEKLLDCAREVSDTNFLKPIKRNFGITFEYILMKDFNDSPEHAREVVKILRGIPCKVNLLQYNENPNTPFKRPSLERVESFQNVLRKAGLLTFLRKSRGRDISAACGQLASARKEGETASVDVNS